MKRKELSLAASLLAVAAGAMLPLTARAYNAADVDLGITHSVKVDIYSANTESEWSEANASGLYLTAGGFTSQNDDSKPSTCDNNGKAVYRLASASYGMSVSEPVDDYYLGDWCTTFPLEAGETINWELTSANIMNSAAFKSEGRLLYNKSATNDNERVMFTRGGKVLIDWVVNTSGSLTETRQRAYMVNWFTSGRPYRIFWTEDNFGGPKISLTDANAQSFKYVRLFGDPAIIAPRYEVTTLSGSSNVSISNIVYGVVVDNDTHSIRAYAKHDSDLDRGQHVGPRGQFVLAYYSTGALEKLIYTIVVEVSEPILAILDAEVGDELKPTGEGYNIDYITANILAGNVDDPSDSNSPYLYKHSGFTDFSPKTGSVFALAPDDAAHQPSGLDSPHKADIYWQSIDPMGTSWPFEHDRYLIRWGEHLPKVVTGGSSDPGCGIFLPPEYANKTEVEHYSSPARIATAATNVVTVTGAGKFLLRVVGNDNIWFLPFESVLNSDTNWHERTAAEWHIGMELETRHDAAAGAGAELAAAVNPDLPGYIYEPNSRGRNWNPNLYHAPKPPVSDEQAEVDNASSSDEDPFAALDSAIYAVNTANAPIEVWWFGSVKSGDMPDAITFPTCAQLYKAIWPLPEETHTIVLASERGSAGESLSATGGALYLGDTNSTAYTTIPALCPSAIGATVGFWLNPESRAAEYDPVVPGRLLTLSNGTQNVVIDVTSATALSVAGKSVTVPTNCWTHIALTIATNGVMTVYRDGESLGECGSIAQADDFFTNSTRFVIGSTTSTSFGTIAEGGAWGAAGVAIDDATVWPFVLPAEELAKSVAGGTSDMVNRRSYEYTFDGAADLLYMPGLPFRFASDAEGRGLMAAIDCLMLAPGGPTRASGLVKKSNGVSPRVYVQNDRNATGYNPNEEHAFLREGADGYTVWALRCDLNTASSSEPFVLVEYASGGKGAMRLFDVTLTNEVYSTLASDVTAGNLLAGPHPLDFLDGYYNTKNYALETTTEPDGYVVYRDRHNRMWARRDGTTKQFNYYPVKEGFYFPSLGANEQPTFGTLVSWMSCIDHAEPTYSQITSAPPLPWTWNVAWPAPDKTPTMRIAQTLTTADSGLPEVWNALSMAVVYPVPRNETSGGEETSRDGTVVTLIDPTVAQAAPLAIEADFPGEYAFTIGPSGTTQLKSGKYFFTGLPPNISDRFYIDMNAGEDKRMTLIGQMVEKKAGTSYLQINTLSPKERQALKDICVATGAAKERWDAGVDALALKEVQPSLRYVEQESVPVAGENGVPQFVATDVVKVSYSPVDHYALVANGCGTNYVTLIENDSADTTVVPEGSTISMHVIRVVPELYAGALVVLQDPNNKLSEQLNVLYTAPLGDSSDNYVFEWRKRLPAADGKVPDAGLQDWELKESGAGMTSILLGGAGANLAELVNTFYEMRYRAVEGTKPYEMTQGAWSAWCGPTLAEGWVQRVLNNVTPFAQRLSDFYNNAAELNYTMNEQIGGPYRGDVALNDANLENVGLIELYQTVLNKAESLSLSLRINDMNANKQLMEAASRLADLYALLGDEAYSDAANPTIGISATTPTPALYDATSCATYCFANQVPSLLDEELALLRGRSAAVAPNMTTYPYYNRLMWNFTKGITQGEMAYVQNYGIIGSDGEITPEQAAQMYPQGHGDAYGHYLSALWGYYRLLRNPYFEWGAPGMMEMLVADSIVNMDYEDEQKFAMAAAKLAQTGLEVVDLTARKTWRDQGGDTAAGYFDSNTDQGFGFGQWAVRTGLGALYNWATVNSLLPTNETASAFADHSIADVTRDTVSALSLISEAFESLDRKVNMLDSGLNPLGLSDNAIPFDIDPAKLAAGTSHFDQILARAERALDNAGTVLSYANKFGSRLSQILVDEGNDSADQETLEFNYNKDLIAIYGTPYPDDIGPAGTYPQGYEGPDIYHYQYVDLSQYGLDELDSKMSYTAYVKVPLNDDFGGAPGAKTDDTVTIAYNVTPGGMLVKPSAWTGVRGSEGSIQTAYRDFLQAYNKVKTSIRYYEDMEGDLAEAITACTAQLKNANKIERLKESLSGLKIAYSVVKGVTDVVIDVAETSESVAEIVKEAVVDSSPTWLVAGLAAGTDAMRAASGAPANAVRLGVKTGADITKRVAKSVQDAASAAVDAIENSMDIAMADMENYDAWVELHWEMVERCFAVETAAFDLQDAYAALVAAEAAYRQEVAKGSALMAEREMVRKQLSNNAVAKRYTDMYLRVQRNRALSKFNSAFDIAQRYVWQLAKVYDYETGLLSSDRQAGDAFLREIVATRALGDKGITVVADGTDGGLWDVVTRMKANWDVLGPTIGANNQDNATKWFSLRYSLFRIKPDSSGDAAWRRELAKYKVDDIFANEEVKRYCKPLQSVNSTPGEPEPGFIIPFSTTVNLAENVFGKPLIGGDDAFSSSDYAIRIQAAGVDFVGYNALTVATQLGLGAEPDIYLVPVGNDYMRTPSGRSNQILAYKVIDQVLPLPYQVGASELSDDDWLASFTGLDGTVDSAATIRRHSTMRVGSETTSTRLVGRSVWNDRWLLVIPAASLSSNRAQAFKTFINGLDSDADGVIDIPGVSDIRLGIKASARGGY